MAGQATGVDACHIMWHSVQGPDTLENGIALCKLHHWAFDRGILSLTNELLIATAPLFVVQMHGGLPIESLNGKTLIVAPRVTQPSIFHLDWHRQNVYLGV